MHSLTKYALCLLALSPFAVAPASAQSRQGGDTVEMLNGQSFKGEVARETDEVVVVRIRMGGGSLEMSLKTRDVYAIIKRGQKRRIVNAKRISSATLTKLRVPSPGRLTPVGKLLAHHAGIYERCSPAVVGITCKNASHQFYGTGVCVSPKGLILTLTSTVPADAENIKVYLQGGTIIEAEIVESCADVEGTLIKIPLGGLPYLMIGDPDKAVIGDVVYTLANPDSVIMKDGRPAFSVGVLSGIYDIAGSRQYSTYTGRVLETDASINRGSDGGPVLDRYGRLIGVISLSFSDSRFMGTAIPVDVIKQKMKKFKLGYGGRAASQPTDSDIVPGLGAAEKLFRSAASRLLPSVVTLEVEHKDRGPAELSLEDKASDPRKAMAVERERFVKGTDAPTTAIVMSRDGLLLTAYSNVSGSIGSIKVHLPGLGPRPAKLVGFDEELDIACLKAAVPGTARLSPMKFEKTEGIRPGTMVALIGRSEPKYDVTLNAGIISATDRNEGRALQADFLTNYGNQGGPVITLGGEVVGIAAFLNAKSRWNQNSGVSLITRSEKILAVWKDLAGGAKRTRAPRPSMGIAPTIGATDVTGARIERVQPRSPAAKAGLKAGDVVVEFDGQRIAEWGDLIRAIRSKSPGDEVELKVLKDGQGPPQTVKVTLKQRARGSRTL
jgi:S1-C subfamily serine protease